MTAADALVAVRLVTAGTIRVDPDVLNFGGHGLDELIEALRSARTCQGDGNCFVVDGRFMALVDETGLVVIIGATRK